MKMQSVETSMSVAFGNAGLDRGYMVKRPEWNASLSFDTAKKLNAPSFDFKNQPRMRFDAMVHMKGSDDGAHAQDHREIARDIKKVMDRAVAEILH